MAEAALNILFENLKTVMSDHYNLISGAENEWNQLKSEVEMMEAFLEESANKSVKGRLFKKYRQKIREAVYEAEIILCDCIEEAQKSKNKSSRTTLRKMLDPKRQSLATQVKNIRENVIQPIFNDAKKDFATLRIPDESDSTNTADAENRKIPFLKEENVVGFDDEAKTVIGYLNEDSDELQVISIIGMPGLGKTTLAWKIYRDQKIQFEFPIRIWVYVSQEFSKRDVYLDILKHFNKRDISAGKTDPELAREVKSHLENKKFILFLDDVWTPENWDDIKAALPKGNKSGKVLITSREKKVAFRANPLRTPHDLRFLTKEESWQLLQLEIFGKEDVCSSELVELGKDIATKCGGLPLAIVVIGGVLADKMSTVGVRVPRSEWEKVLKSVSSYFFKYDKEESTKRIIELSYNKLPYSLQKCFLYMGMFKEDTEILAWKLIRMWIAEGFIQKDPDLSLEEVAEENLRDLINRNLVMVGKTKAEAQVKTCRVHDMIRDFCKNMADFSEENFFQEVKKTREGMFYPDIHEIRRHYRLCIHSDVVEFLHKKPKGPLTRSFVCFSKEVTLPLEYNTSISDAFSLLWVLEVNSIKFTKFPIKLAQLRYLRYIALSGDKFKILPKDFSELWNLQTIRIDTTERTLEVKGDIWNMKELRHFKTKAAISLKKGTKSGEGKNLRTLSRLSVQSCTEDVFSRASNLNTLGIRGDLSLLLKSTCLKNLDRLQKLKLLYDVSPVSASEKPLCDLPRLNWFPPNMRILTLSSTFLEWKHMQTLGMLKKLEVLQLKENAFMGKLWNTNRGGFSSLEFLHMGRTDLESWTVLGDNPFPRLKCLVLKNCEQLKKIPLVLGESLEVLDIECVDKTTVECAKKIEEQAEQRMREAKQGRVFKLIISPGDLQTMAT